MFWPQCWTAWGSWPWEPTGLHWISLRTLWWPLGRPWRSWLTCCQLQETQWTEPKAWTWRVRLHCATWRWYNCFKNYFFSHRVILLYYIILVFATVLNFVLLHSFLMQLCCCPPQQERQNSSRLHPLTEMTKSLLKNVTNTYLMLEDVKRVRFTPFPLPRNS